MPIPRKVVLSGSASLLEQPHAPWIVLALIVTLFAITNIPWTLDKYDQAKQAFTSFEMVKEGHWLYQRTPNEKVATKPPLLGWVSAAVFGATRSWAIAWRLPSFAAALALLALLNRAATNACGPIAGFIALSAFGLNMLSLRLATLVRTDMPLALIIFLLGWQIFEKIRCQEPWQTRDRILTFLFLTAAMLIKGPIVYAFLLPGIALFQWRMRKAQHSVGAWCGWWPWLTSLAIFCCWVTGGILLVPGFFSEVVVREFFGRFGETVHKPQKFYFYLPHLLHKFAPWSLLMIALAAMASRNKEIGIEREINGDVRKYVPPGRSKVRILPETFWLVCWSLGGLIVMSLIPSKRVDRIFPVIPPFCLLLAVLFGYVSSQENLRRRTLRWSAIALVLACVFNLVYSATKIVGAYRDNRGALSSFGHAVRAAAKKHGWRYDVIGRREDEGMLLYLERLYFTEPEEVISRWGNGEINAVISPEEERPRLLRDLEGSVPARLRSWKSESDRAPRYILLTRS